MRIFEIFDEENNLSIGVLLYYEREHTFIIELQEYLDEWTAPLHFSYLVKDGIYTVPRELSIMWVRSRIIPSGRQNINSILKTHKLKEYDEMKFLELSGGRCSQDSICIRRIDTLPPFAMGRRDKNITDCVALSGDDILCFFADSSVKKIDLTKLSDMDGIDKVLANRSLFNSCKTGTGGYFITFNDSIDIDRNILYEIGETIPLTLEDFYTFASTNLLDTTESCDILECSRQNLSYLVQEQKLSPIKENVRGNLYLKGDVLRGTW